MSFSFQMGGPQTIAKAGPPAAGLDAHSGHKTQSSPLHHWGHQCLVQASQLPALCTKPLDK